jgi:hypothetical protein
MTASDFDQIKNVIDSETTFEDLEEASDPKTRVELFKEKPELAKEVLKFMKELRKITKRD